MNLKTSKYYIPGILIGISIFLIIFGNNPISRGLNILSGKVLLPIQSSFYDVRIGLIGSSNDLEKENRRLVSLLSKADSCQKENADMRRLLGAPLPQNWRFLPARIIGWDNNSLLIDKGSADKLTKEMSVVFEDTFVGRISYLGENYSRVDTPISNNLKVPVVVKNFDGEGEIGRGIISSSAGKIYLERVLPSEKIIVGNYVLTSGEGNFPPGLPIGKIKRVLSKEIDIFQRAEIEPLVEYDKIGTVFVVIFR
jgi:rod shape-determining protein MreC